MVRAALLASLLVTDARASACEGNCPAKDSMLLQAKVAAHKSEATTPNVLDSFVKVGNGACRTASGGTGAYTTTYLGRDACAVKCNSASSCVAFEWTEHNNACEIHTAHIASVADVKATLECWSKIITTDVVIVGGGAAGIAAGRRLREANISFVIVEGRDVLGGRARDAVLDGFTIEDGANWIHGPWAVEDDGNRNQILWDLKQSVGLNGGWTNYSDFSIVNRDGSIPASSVGKKWHGKASHASTSCSNRGDTLWEQAADEELDPEESIDIGLQNCFAQHGFSLNGVSEEERGVAETFYWEYTRFNFAMPPETTSVMWQYPFNLDYIDRDWLCTDQRGFAETIRSLALDFPSGSVKLGHEVTNIAYSESAVTVTTAAGATIRGTYGISTLPLGVMQHRAAELFTPAFSQEKMDGINGMVMGNYAKITLHFPSSFWGDAEILLITGTPDATNYLSWGINLNHPQYFPGSNMVSFHVSDELARMVETQLHATTEAQVMTQLRGIYGSSIPDPIGMRVTNWTNDPWAYGSYSAWPLGYTWYDWDAMTQSEGHLFFAGEHTNENFGFLHGAYDTGVAAAEDVLVEMGLLEAPTYDYYEDSSDLLLLERARAKGGKGLRRKQRREQRAATN